MKRKLISQGGTGSATIYLPKKWIRKRNLKPGDEIQIDEVDGTLVISSESGEKLKELIIDIKEEDLDRIRTIISSAYRRGYDLLTLKSTKKLPFVEINKLVDSLTGYVLVEQDKEKIVIKSMIKTDVDQVSSMLNKFTISIRYLQNSIIDFLQNDGDVEELKEIRKSIMKLRDFCQRSIHLTNYKGDKSYEYNTMVFIMEKIANNNFFDCIQIKDSLKKAERSKLAAELTKHATTFNNLISALSNKNVDAVIKINKQLWLDRTRAVKSKAHPVIANLLENLFSLSSRIIGVLL